MIDHSSTIIIDEKWTVVFNTVNSIWVPIVL
jgi:hypothetical protein